MGIAQDGSGNIAVQVDGSNNSVTVTRGQARLMLLQRHKQRRQPRKHLDLLDPNFRAIDLVGRGDDLAALGAWLEDPAPEAAAAGRSRPARMPQPSPTPSHAGAAPGSAGSAAPWARR